MKKIILAVAAVCTFGFANAQDANSFGFTKGDVLVEGNFTFRSTNNKNTEVKENQSQFNPKVGYFLTDKFALGVELGVGSSNAQTRGISTSESSNFSAGVFGRYYFLDLGQRFKTYAEAGVGFGNTRTGIGAAEVESSGVGFGAGLGINYFISKSFAINFGLTDILSFNSSKVENGEPVSSFNANANIFNNFFTTAQFGLTYKF